MSTNCPFCNLPQSSILYETEQFRVIRDIYPRAQDHFLVVSRTHLARGKELDGALYRGLDLALAFQGSKHIEINQGKPYQEIDHFHIHVMGSKLRVPVERMSS